MASSTPFESLPHQPVTPARPLLPAEGFLKELVELGLLDPAEVRTWLGRVAAGDRQNPARLAEHLTHQARLTPYQAASVLQGRGRNLVVGNYLILDHLGAGGMGTVFKARHRLMQRLVALKVLPPASTCSAVGLQRFRREVQAAARLAHPNIVAAYDADQAQGIHFLVLEYVEGTDLSRLVKKRGPLPVAQAVGCVLQAARGLEHAHGLGVIHRDIKPANLLLDTRGTLKILDMGLARLEAVCGQALDEAAGRDLTQLGGVVGTVDYMAPEQATDSHRADHRADIYGLGCTLHYLLSGRTLFAGETAIEILLAHREQPVPSLHQQRSDVPEWLERVFRRMVAKRPEDRYPSAHNLLVDLETRGGSRPRLRSTMPPQTAIRPQEDWLAPGAAETLLGLEEGAPTEARWGSAHHRLGHWFWPAVVMGGLGLGLVTFVLLRPHTAAAPSRGVPVAARATGAAAETMKALPCFAREAPAAPQDQVQEMGRRLKALNPQFDERLTYRAEGGTVRELAFSTDHVTDLSPLRGLTGLKRLACTGSGPDQGKLRDLKPLQDLRLTELVCSFNPGLSDLRALQGMRLEMLDCANTGVEDLAPLRGMPLSFVHCHDSRVRDLSPLRDSPLRTLRCDFDRRRDLEVLRSLKTLQKINGQPAEEFWKKTGSGLP